MCFLFIKITGFAPRPGIVLDDPEYKPGLKRPIAVAQPSHGQKGEIFDITVSAIQGPDASKTGQPVVYPGKLDKLNFTYFLIYFEPYFLVPI